MCAARRRRRARIHPPLRSSRRCRDGGARVARASSTRRYASLPAEQREALEQAAESVRSYHERQRQESWEYTDEPTARASARRSRRSIASACTCRAAGVLSQFGADERDPGQGGRCWRTDHGRADARRRKQSAGAGCRGDHRRRSRVHHRRRPGGRRAGVRHATHSAGRQDRRPRQCLRGRAPSAACSARRHRHGGRAVRGADHLRRFMAIRTGWRWISSPRPSTTNWPSPSCCAPTPPSSIASQEASIGCCPRCRAATPSRPR
jgi:hypothetical protein